MKAVIGNRIVAALLAVALLALAGCAANPVTHLSTDAAKAQYGKGAMPTDNYATSG